MERLDGRGYVGLSFVRIVKISIRWRYFTKTFLFIENINRVILTKIEKLETCRFFLSFVVEI